MTPQIERVFEPSAIRRGRLATSPVWFVQVPGWRYRFTRKLDAQRFINLGAECPQHEEGPIWRRCIHCMGGRVALDEQSKE